MRSRVTTRYHQNKLSYLGYFHLAPMLGKMTVHRLGQVLCAIADWRCHVVRPSSRPFAFRLEPCATCNLRCPLCATTYREFTVRDTKVMTTATFQAIHEQIKAHAAKITFYLEGEPMLNPYLFEMIELATRGNNVFTSFSTNFTQMKERLLRPMFASRLDWISVSIDGFHQETYEKYRVGGNVKDVLNGISMTMRYKRRYGFRYPYMIVNMIAFSHVPLDEQKLLQEFCNEQGVDAFHLRPDQYGIMGPYDPTIVRRPANRCHWPWFSMSITPDGAVYPCPIAFEQRLSYGNLLTESLDEIWNNDLYVATREYLSRPGDDRSDMPHLPCFDCRWFGKCAPVSDVVQIRHDWLRKSHERAEARELRAGATTSTQDVGE